MSNKSGLLFVVSSPSGAGKTTLCRQLQQKHPALSFSVSYTTRKPRGKEVHGQDYFFVDDDAFDNLIAEKAFAEWAHVHGHRYGTSVQTVREVLDRGAHVMFDIDYQGAERLKAQFPKEARLIYIVPPSLEVLAQRLRSRGTESHESVNGRLQKAKEELAHYPSYDYVVLNDDMNQALGELSAIYQVEQSQDDTIPPWVSALAWECVLRNRAFLVERLLA